VARAATEACGLSAATAPAQPPPPEAARHALVMEADSGSGPVWRLDAAVAPADWPWVAALAAELGLEPGHNGRPGGADLGEMRKLGTPELIARQDASRYFDVHHTRADTVEALDRAGMSQATGVFATLAHAASERGEPLGRVVPAPAP
jgi:hypothetical protein